MNFASNFGSQNWSQNKAKVEVKWRPKSIQNPIDFLMDFWMVFWDDFGAQKASKIYDFLIDFKDTKEISKNGIIGFRRAARIQQDTIYGGGALSTSYRRDDTFVSKSED